MMNSRLASSRVGAAFVVLAAVLVAGCGPDLPDTAAVSGTVTYDGQPVTQGTVTFYPEKGRSSTGRIQPDGTYTLRTFTEGDGALLGKHTVTIEAMEFTGGPPQPKSMEEEIAMAADGRLGRSTPGESRWLVPRRYASRETSKLTADVAAGPNTIDFKLPAE